VKLDREIWFYRHLGGLQLRPANAKGFVVLIVMMVIFAGALGACFLLQAIGAPDWLLTSAIAAACAAFLGGFVLCWIKSEPGRGRRWWGP
jgi:uncharacterized membrane protein